MNKLLLSKIVYAFMLILASSQIGKSNCMEENQTSQGHTIYDTIYDAFYEELSEENKLYLLEKIKPLCGDTQQYKRHAAKYITSIRKHDECDAMKKQDPLIRAKDSRENKKRLDIQKRHALIHAIKSSIGMTAGLFLGQLILGLKPQLIDIVPNCASGVLVAISDYTLPPLIPAMLWTVYTTWRLHNQAHQYPYNHWLRSILQK